MVSVLPTANADIFYRRIGRVYNSWDELFKVDAIVVPVGRSAEIEYCKSLSSQEWLFGMEIPDLLMIFAKNAIVFLAAKKKIDFLKTLQINKDGVPKVTLLVRDKDDSNKANFEKILSIIKSNGTNLGVFSKDKFEGEFYEECLKNLYKPENNFERKDASPAMAVIMAVKDESELQYIQKACTATETTYSRVLLKELTTIIDKEKKVSHGKLSAKLNDAISKEAGRYLEGFDSRFVDTCYSPIIQSGGNYALKFATLSNDEDIHCGIIISSIGVRYRRYCSNVSRTLMIDPTEEQKKNYEFLLEVLELIINNLYEGAVLSDIYNSAVEFVKSKRPDLVNKLTKNFGFVTGIEFREGHMVIGPKTNVKAKKNMTFVISAGFTDLVNKSTSDPKAKNYALFVSDTVIVNEAGTPANLLTQRKRKLTKTMILLKNTDESEEEDEENNVADKPDNDVIMTESLRGGTRRRVLEDRLRQDQFNDEKRRQHQKELLEQINEAARARLSKSGGERVEQKAKKSVVAYKSTKDFPRENEISDLKIFVDKRNEAVILPVFGLPVPFHISTIKNVSTSVEGDYLYLRINFYFPGSTLEKGQTFPTTEATFLKELTYRSYALKEQGEVNPPAQNLNDSFVAIKTVQKKYKTRIDEEKELEGVVKQDTLMIANNKVGPKLKDLYIRPNIYQKRISGSLEAHVNGFRFTSIRNDKVDILYNNIKHAIYQPCDGEMIILIHFNLKSPIIINKKKQFDIQFYTEVGEITTDLGKRQHMHDRDDYAAEAAERDLRNKLKLAFKSFCDKVEAATKGDVQFEMPMRELSFYGVPKKSNVLLQPTPSALVNLTDPDPTVITLSEIELVHFERVSFQLKNFDMVIVLKDYNQKELHISAIEMSKLEEIKNWLDRCDIKFTSGTTNLNWPALLKRIKEDIDGFFNEGGWSFLDSDAEDEEGEEDEDESGDDQYNPSEDETEEEEDEDESELEEEESEYEDSEGELGSSEESGKDWSELEEEAAKADRNNRFEDAPATTGRRPNGAQAAKRKSYDDGRGGGAKKRR
uniref:FACT complex subunit n=1 Tax=Aceria tosichella TaxID=561515 RepID=A0A6G1S525_9ACAR